MGLDYSSDFRFSHTAHYTQNSTIPLLKSFIFNQFLGTKIEKI
jgi:hypothetical protein